VHLVRLMGLVVVVVVVLLGRLDPVASGVHDAGRQLHRPSS